MTYPCSPMTNVVLPTTPGFTPVVQVAGNTFTPLSPSGPTFAPLAETGPTTAEQIPDVHNKFCTNSGSTPNVGVPDCAIPDTESFGACHA